MLPSKGINKDKINKTVKHSTETITEEIIDRDCLQSCSPSFPCMWLSNCM